MSLVRLLVRSSFVVICVTFIVLTYNPQVLFWWHPVCMLLAFVEAMGEGMIVIKSYPRSALWTRIHLVLQSSSMALSSAGFAAVFYNKIINNKPHFVSWHAWLGVAALILNSFQALLGIKIYFFAKGTPSAVLRQQRKYHKYLGIATYLTSLVAVAFGFVSGFSIRTLGEVLSYCAIIIVLTLGTCVTFMSRSKSKMQS